MTPQQIALIQNSFVHILPISDETAAHFYARLFEIAPEVRPLFRGDLVVQGQKLVMTLATIVDGLDRLDALLPVARELAIRHVAYGVRDRHYAAVGAALIDTLRARVGDHWSADAEAAWVEAYGLLSDAMIEAGRRAA